MQQNWTYCNFFIQELSRPWKGNPSMYVRFSHDLQQRLQQTGWNSAFKIFHIMLHSSVFWMAHLTNRLDHFCHTVLTIILFSFLLSQHHNKSAWWWINSCTTLGRVDFDIFITSPGYHADSLIQNVSNKTCFPYRLFCTSMLILHIIP